VEQVKVVHALPGRVRLKVRELKENPALAGAVQKRLAGIRGVQLVDASPVTGSVLVVYVAEGSEVLEAVCGALTPLFPALNVEQFQAELTAFQAQLRPHANAGSGDRIHLDRSISGFFGSVNSGVGSATGGVDLKVLVPLGLVVLGVRSLFVTDRLAVPAWYDFIWFAFGTYLALNNNSGVEAGA
jgi:putative ubiquitin-RnfH superfamily antitoxin RatB of RatAB toxin-antitoxin module